MRGLGRIVGACVIAVLLAGCKTQLYTSLSEHDAMEMVAVLLDHGIQADRVIAKDGTSTIEVDEGRVANAVSTLRASHYPRADFASMDEVFQQKGMVSSPTAERARYIYGLTQELSRTLSDIDGVLTTRVHVVLPQNDPLDGETKPSAAAVFIRFDSSVEMVKLLPEIKMLVANSIEGLSYDKVSVVLLPVTLPSAAKTPQLADASPWLSAGWVLAFALSLGGGALLFWHRRRSQAALPAPELPKLRRVA